MQTAKHLLIVLCCAVLAGGLGFAWHEWQSPAQAQVPRDQTAADDAAPPAAPAPTAPEIDARLADLQDRGDGARLLLPADAAEGLLRVAFANNTTLIISSKSTEPGQPIYSLSTFDLTSRRTLTDLKGPVERYASSHRPANRNAGRFCYAENALGDKLDLWCSDNAWKKPRRLTTHDGPEDLIEPSLSPDGGWAAFEVNTDRVNAKRGKPGMSAIWKIGLNGAGLQQLTRGADDRRPAWSEDGQRIYFQRRLSDGDWDLYTIGADGSEPTPVLSTYDQDEQWPDPVPGSEKIAAAVGVKGDDARLKTIDAETKAGTFLTDGKYGSVSSVSVSPDGRLIAFLAPVDPADPSRLGIWLRAVE